MFPNHRITYPAKDRSTPKQLNASNKFQFRSEYSKDYGKAPYYSNYASKKESGGIKDRLESESKPREQYFKTLNSRRKNEGHMSNLKLQLQNLKSEVNKLINKETVVRTPKKQKVSQFMMRNDASDSRLERTDKKISYGYRSEYESSDGEDVGYQEHKNRFKTQNDDDFSDSSSMRSMTSVTTEKVLHQPLRALSKKAAHQNYDPQYYMKLENDLLKTEIKNLKNKYVSKKRQLNEKCVLLEKKNQFLEISLQKSEQALLQCRRSLQMEMVTIKKQISQQQKQKIQLQEDNLASNDVNQPQKDTNDQSNKYLKEKIKTLYAQLNAKNAKINNLSVEIGDLESLCDKKKFDLKKQTEKNFELSKQIEFARRQQSRQKQYLETQLSKKKQLQAQIASLKASNKQLASQIYAKDQIVTGSEQYQNRLSEQLEQYKQKQDKMLKEIMSLKEENKKLKTINQSNQDQIFYLKQTTQETTKKLNQISRKLKDQQEKWLEKEDHYRSTISENKRRQEEKMKILKEQYESHQSKVTETFQKNHHAQNSQVNELLKEKDKQINKWKAEYKILKLKHSDRNNSERIKKEEMDQYYKGYTKYKHQNTLLDKKIAILEKNLKQLQQNSFRAQEEQLLRKVETQKIEEFNRSQRQNLIRQLKLAQDEINRLTFQLNELTLKMEQQGKYRQNIEEKIRSFIHDSLDSQDDQNGQDNLKKQGHSNQQGKRKKMKLSQSQKIQLQNLNQAITSIKKRVIQQDQKASKAVRQIKNKDTQLAKLRKQIKELLETHEKQISQLKQKYEIQAVSVQIKKSMTAHKQAEKHFAKQIELWKQKYEQILLENTEMKRKNNEHQRELLALRQQTTSLAHLYNVKSTDAQDQAQRHSKDVQNYEQIIKEIHASYNQKQTMLKNQINQCKDQINSLRMQIRSSVCNSLNSIPSGKNFDQALKEQMEGTKNLRTDIQKKNDEIFRLRDTYTTLRSQYDNLRSQMQMQKLKGLSERKNLQVQNQIQVQNIKNCLSIEEKKISSLEQKISLVIEENKKKDTFIQSYIMGKKLPQNQKQFLSQFVKQYEIQLSGKMINEKLKGDSHELQKMTVYNYNLLKDMADIKQKMLLYETMENDAISLYQSRQGSFDGRDHDFDFSQPSRIMGSTEITPRKNITTSQRLRQMKSLAEGVEDAFQSEEQNKKPQGIELGWSR